ncbi:MAG TPA: PAS domain S-box protein, partial [Planctomycetota bacterium]|nr:PAS domain S-box protein [Planctomycetota bacterium]
MLDLARFFSLSHDLGFVTDVHGAVLAATPGAERALGYSQSELKGVDLSSLDEGGDLRRFFESSPTRSRMNLGFHLRTRSGSLLALGAMASCLRDEEGTPRGWFIAGQDLNGAVAESREAPTILEALVDSIGAAVWSFDRNGRVITWGRSCEKAFGIPKGQAEGKLSVVRLFQSPAEYRRVVESVDRDGRFSGELILVGADGAALPNSVSVTPLVSDGFALGYTAVSFDIAQRRRAEELQRSLFEQAGEAIVVVDLNGHRIVDVNDRACEVYGYTKEEFSRVSVDLLRLNPTVSIEEVDRRLRETGRYESEREPGRRKDGSSFPCSLNIRLIRVGGKEYTVAVVRDLTPERRAEEFFRVLFEKASDSIFLVEDRTQQVVEANEAACRMLGYTREEFLRLKVPDLVPPELRHRIAGVRQHLVEGGGYQRDRRLLLRKDGTSVPTDHAITQLDLGGCRFYLASSRDLTLHEAAAQELAEAKAFLEHLQENANDGFALLDENGVYISVNQSLLNILGARREDMIGRSYQSRSDPKSHEEYARYWQRQMQGEKISMRTTIMRPDGRPVICEIRSAPIKRGSRTFIFAILRDVTDQVHAREDLERRVAERAAELFQSEERFRASFTQGGIGMALVGLDGRFLQLNRALCGMLGYQEEELLRKSFKDITHPEDQEKSLELARHMVRERQLFARLEKRYLHRDGHFVWCDLSTTLVQGPRGEDLYFVSSFQDITDRKRSEETVRQSEARFRAITEGTPVPTTITRPDGKVVFVNLAAARLFGLGRDEALGRMASEFYADQTDRENMRARLLQDGELSGYELKLRRSDGTAFWTMVNLRTVTFEGEPAIFSSFVDIDARKRAEEALRQSESRYRALAENTAVGVWHTTIEGRTIYANPAMLSILGLSKLSDLDHRRVEDFFPPAVLEKIGEEHRKHPQGFSTEGEIVRQDGSRRQVVLFGGPMPSLDKPPGASIRSIIDVTERKQAEIALRESEERFRAITEGVPVAVIIARTSDGVILYGNEQAAESLGLATGMLEGRSVPEFLAQPEQRTQLMERLSRGDPALGLEIQFRRSDGALFWGAASLRLASFRGEPVTLGVFSDITARKESDVLLKKAHEELEQHVLERTAELARANELLQDEIAERKRAENALRLILEGTATVTGGSFFRSLARHLASALNVRFASVVQKLPQKPGYAQTISFWTGSGFADPLEYALEGTPGEDVLGGEACSYGHDVQRLYPQDRQLADLGVECYLGVPMLDSSGSVVGLISVMDVKPASDEERKLSVLKIFA